MKQSHLMFFFIFFLSFAVFGHNEAENEIRRTAISNGIGLGTVIAVVASWERNKSVLMAIICGIFSWLYVIYYVLTRTREEEKR